MARNQTGAADPAAEEGPSWCCACNVPLPAPFGFVAGGPKGRRWLCHGCFGLGLGDPHYKARVNRMVARELPRLPGKEVRFRAAKAGTFDPEARLRWVKAVGASFPAAKSKRLRGSA